MSASTTIPSIEALRRLNGRIVSKLSSVELEVLEFYQCNARRFDVSIQILSKVSPGELTRATSLEHTNEILRNSYISVFVGPEAEVSWARHTGRIH